jgi:hypothetical protein
MILYFLPTAQKKELFWKLKPDEQLQSCLTLSTERSGKVMLYQTKQYISSSNPAEPPLTYIHKHKTASLQTHGSSCFGYSTLSFELDSYSKNTLPIGLGRRGKSIFSPTS